MLKHFLFTTYLLLAFIVPALAQKTKPAANPGNDAAVLFTVNNQPVTVGEFRYIYTKTNQDKADFSEKSLREYLDLYTTFKLKVAKAREMRLDTVQALREELEGYRRQLANSYLVDKEVTDKLVREAYDRMQQDVDISHVLVAVARDAKAVDTLRAYNRATTMLKLIQSGKASFEQLAADSSDDKSSRANKGSIGFVTAMLPDGFYSMERAIYGAKAGVVVPTLIRSNSGYHIVRVNSFRPARGKMEVAHILFRKSGSAEKDAMIQQRADSVYNALVKGGDWDTFTAKYSDDKVTSPKKGYLGVFGISQYQRAFEDAAFALAKDGDISKPVETTIGWHIIKRIGARPVGKFDDEKRGLTERVRRDSRSEVARQSMIARIKRDAKAQEFRDVLAKWTAQQRDSVFLTFKWKPDPAKPQDVLMRFGKDKVFTVAEFEDYAARASRDRMRGAGTPIGEVVDKLYKSWSEEMAIGYEEAHLAEKYPDFRALMREYEEGILLFDALKRNVWDRANTDSVGLENYFNTALKGKYNWEERARIAFYTIKSDDAKLAAEIRAYASSHTPDEVKTKFNKADNETLTVMEKVYEKGKNKEFESMWRAGAMTETKTDTGTKTATFSKLEAIIAPGPKTLADARGYAVADYQDFLEKQWVEELRKQYAVKVNEEVLKGMVKK